MTRAVLHHLVIREGGVELVMKAIEKAGYKDKCKIGMYVAASEFKV